MDINGLISSLSPEAISAAKQVEVQLAATTSVAKKALDTQKVAGEAIIKLLQQAALQTGKGVNLDELI